LNETRIKLSQLYLEKGELITNIELSEERLRFINKEIVKIKNDEYLATKENKAPKINEKIEKIEKKQEVTK
jgi:hypothetical protein